MKESVIPMFSPSESIIATKSAKMHYDCLSPTIVSQFCFEAVILTASYLKTAQKDPVIFSLLVNFHTYYFSAI